MITNKPILAAFVAAAIFSGLNAYAQQEDAVKGWNFGPLPCVSYNSDLGFQYGAEKMGMLTVPAAAGNTKRQIKFMTDFGTTAVHAIPSYATRLYEVMEEQGIDPTEDLVAVVTNDFHIARSRLIAARQGYGHVFGIPARLPWRHLEVNYYLREAFAMVKTWIFD